MRKEHSPLLYVKIFLVIFFVAAVVSVIYKGITLFNSSTFKGEAFNVLYIGDKNTLIHISSEDKKIILVDLPKDRVSGSTRVAKSAIAGILFDGMILAKDDQEISFDKFLSFSDFIKITGYKLDNMNDFDLLKIYFLTTFSPKSGRENLSDIKDASVTAFADKAVLNEQISISVVNASEIDGLGSKISSALKSAGFNVVSVGSSGKKKSKITTNNPESETVRRLQRTLKIPVKKTNQTVTDITVVVGEDLIR